MIVIIIGVIFLLLWYCSILWERRKCKKQFEILSNQINEMINQKKLTKYPETLETLPSKVYGQLTRLQEIYVETQQKVREQQEDTQKLITEIAHQLRNPLMNIQNYLELLEEFELDEEERKQYLQAIRQSEERLSFLVESFIKMSRLENELIQIKPDLLDLRETILQAVFQIRKKAEEKQIEIEIKQSQKIQVMHDRNWLKEAVFNILDNSVKYSYKNSKIVITLIKNEMFTEIAVRDYGIGIEPQEEAKIFQRFYRGIRVTTEEGFGIGLYLSREIALKQKGFVKVKRKNPGLEVSLFLP